MQSAIRDSSDYNTIQEAIDQGPGTVYIPAGTHIIDVPLKLPRTDISGSEAVALKGAGIHKTFIVPNSGYTHNSIITWNDATNDRRRAWFQHLEGFTLRLPDRKAFGIWYEFTHPNPIYQKMTITMRDICIQTFNNWKQIAIRLEGNIHDAVFENIFHDIGSRALGNLPASQRIRHDNTTIVVDTNPNGDDGLDNYGLFSSLIKGLTVTPISGGRGGAFKVYNGGALTH